MRSATTTRTSALPVVRIGPTLGSSSHRGTAAQAEVEERQAQAESRARAEANRDHPLLRGTRRPETCRRTSFRIRLRTENRQICQLFLITTLQETPRQLVLPALPSTFHRHRNRLLLAGRLRQRNRLPIRQQRLQERRKTRRHKCKFSSSTSKSFARCTVPRRQPMR